MLVKFFGNLQRMLSLSLILKIDIRHCMPHLHTRTTLYFSSGFAVPVGIKTFFGVDGGGGVGANGLPWPRTTLGFRSTPFCNRSLYGGSCSLVKAGFLLDNDQNKENSLFSFEFLLTNTQILMISRILCKLKPLSVLFLTIFVTLLKHAQNWYLTWNNSKQHFSNNLFLPSGWGRLLLIDHSHNFNTLILLY